MQALFNLPAPAKINWFLHVTGRRPDGYHTLQTVFQFIDWNDSLDLIRRDDGVIRRIGADDLPADDLCVRTARLLQEDTGCTSGVDIHLRKSIPQQAGLGGGSSDAATVLIGLNRLWRLGLTRDHLMRLALKLGADVPIFIYGRNAWAEGVGEKLQAIDLPTPWFLVVHPGRGLSTSAVFSTLDLTTPRPEAKIMGFAEWLFESRRFFRSCGLNEHEGMNAGKASAEEGPGSFAETIPSKAVCALWGRNDLQPGAIALEPEVARAMELVRTQFGRRQLALPFDVRMTGSGSAVFALVDVADMSEGQSERGLTPGVMASWPSGWAGRLCQGLREHPLRHWIQA
ncbi:4-(cytidine 5'-diphospho)-2-C-methyl-D-erythritol kinase [Thiomonas bhubaneswarensis]|uniref:4-diphosphocytidyl-2-C-methyl-D-erythritol kinase n=1 Tax=Thiomonas bhubaneswarensis TaxID=339866 RepID=A0A0K6HY32_9BURK|nr:4-(cytidine 5'-diphospho)-2-C-methyl-D-erythritol kinase [Thiomonas bhubaneswarensis]CUA95736.1 4-diphosphocytidyl-2-C-methyl-D-erythritol kinase [Thiomonas bhubaneswarensis]